jgi:hypothetical protein
MYTELWEHVLTFVDLPTLRTARLVSQDMCAAASKRVKRVSINWRAGNTRGGARPTDLPRLLKKCTSLAKVPLGLFDGTPFLQLPSLEGVWCRITHINLSLIGCPTSVMTQVCSSPELFPGLVGLHTYGPHTSLVPWLRSFPKLRELRIDTGDPPDMYEGYEGCSDIVMMTNLTKLVMPLPNEAGCRVFSLASASWSSLSKLQNLTLTCHSGCSPLLLKQAAQVTSLTELALRGTCGHDDPPELTWLTTLTKLQNLRFVRVRRVGDDEVEYFASPQTLEALGQMPWVADLEFDLGPGCDLRVLSAVTGLSRMRIHSYLGPEFTMCSLRSLSVRNMANLRQLCWLEGSLVSPGMLSVLRSATKLTNLAITFRAGPNDANLDVGGAVAMLTNLAKLCLRFDVQQPAGFIDYAVALSPLTGLTRLQCKNAGMTDAGLIGVKHLTLLYHLDVSVSPLVTRAGLAHLTDLTRLDDLALIRTGVLREDITDDFRRLFDVRRVASSWPPIHVWV